MLFSLLKRTYLKILYENREWQSFFNQRYTLSLGPKNRNHIPQKTQQGLMYDHSYSRSYIKREPITWVKINNSPSIKVHTYLTNTKRGYFKGYTTLHKLNTQRMMSQVVFLTQNTMIISSSIVLSKMKHSDSFSWTFSLVNFTCLSEKHKP